MINYLYLIAIDLGWITIMKIGVAQNVESRMRHMEKQTERPCRIIAKWGFTGKYGDCLQNYRIENQIHSYLEDCQFPMWEHFPNFGGKTECFDCSINKALSAIALGIRWTESNPRPIKKGSVITYKGYNKNKKYINQYD